MFRSFATALLTTIAFAAEGVFDYKDMGAHWTGLCETGKKQSPIDLPWEADNSSVQSVILNNKYPDLTNAKTVDKELTVEVYMKSDKSLYTDAHFTKTFQDGSSLELIPERFHIHTPSEHTINGKPMDLELHIVHWNADRTVAGVLGFLFDVEEGGSGENLFLD